MELVQRTDLLMGNRFDIGVIASQISDAEHALQLAVDEIKRIEALLSTYQADSLTNQINDAAGLHPVAVTEEFFQLVLRCQRISSLTQGAFDLTYGSVDKKLWNFDRTMTALPDEAIAKKSVRLINYKWIELDPQAKTIFLKKKGMRIGFGGIGKGYAADQAKQLLVGLGYENGLVNASGDMCAWGFRADGNPWHVGIVDPDHPKDVLADFDLVNAAVATSGTYEKFVLIDGKRYSHTIHPKTGMPVQGVKSVSVFAPFAELADALTTPIAVMGVEVGLDLVNQLQGVTCVIVDDENQVHFAKKIDVCV
jgi:thiamine biosynthesis lipoprotein